MNQRVIGMDTKTFRKGREIQLSELPDLQAKKRQIWIVTNFSEQIMYPYELLSWQLRSLLKCKLHLAIKLKEYEYC